MASPVDTTSSAQERTPQEIEDLRLALLRNGYTPLPNFDKRNFWPGWPRNEIDAEEIHRWTRRERRFKATGLRIENLLCALDLDIDHEIVDEIADAILDICPQLEKDDVPLLVRKGKGRKEAWFVRTDQLFSRIHSRRWIAPGTDVDAGTHSVEIFGGASPRQFGAFGAHTRQEDGTVAVNYSWPGASPADTPQSELPVVTKAQCFLIVDAVERIFKDAGWTVVERSTKGENDAVRAYDLNPDMFFDLADGRRLSLLELREAAQHDEGLRCSASWLEGPTAARTDRCIIGTTKTGQLTIWESASGVSHMEASAKPRDYSLEMDRIAEKLRELEDRQRYALDTRDAAMTTATKLRGLYAFCPRQQASVVPIWASSLDEGVTLSAFRTDMLKYSEIEVGPRGGERRINPANLWECDSRRITVDGLAMRPDKERPLFEDQGKKWVNVYDPPAHDATGGDASLGVELIDGLLPDEDERRYFWQWLACKFQNPHIPGPAVLMVARQFGTGRGSLGRLLGKVFGPQYAQQLSFTDFTGKTYQSQYNEWAAQALLVMVNESSEQGSQTAYAAKTDAYEHIKDIVDPLVSERQIKRKGMPNYRAPSFTSFLIATNHPDAIKVPRGDRRIAVLTNGLPRPPEFWVAAHAWMDNAANVAAFCHYLRTVDLEGYSPHEAPPETAGKANMVEEGMSDFDTAFDVAVRALPSPLMTLPQIEAAVRQAASTNGLFLPDKWNQIMLRKHAAKNLYRVGVRDSTNWQLKEEGKKVAIYARSAQIAALWRDSDRLREEALKNGALLGDGNVVAGLFRLQKGE